LSSGELRRGPVSVSLCGRRLVLFRAAGGEAAALEDVCPHRRSKLSTGVVVGGRLRCPYHGWTFDACGNGESPGTPRLTAEVASYEAREEQGYVWVKPRGAEAPFPEMDTAGYARVGELRHRMPAPLELVVDNFLEVEHTTINHETFGHDLDGIGRVRVTCDSAGATARVLTRGPTKRIRWWKRLFLGARPDFDFVADDTVHFSPVFVRFDHRWASPDDTREGMVRWRLYLFFVPEDDGTTSVVSFMYAKSRWPAARLLWKAVGPIFLWETDREVKRDVALLANLADRGTGLEGLKLGRFDKIMALTREGIARIYRGER
jgi:vanillate O-demethylase monooxygenase subunit